MSDDKTLDQMMEHLYGEMSPQEEDLFLDRVDASPELSGEVAQYRKILTAYRLAPEVSAPAGAAARALAEAKRLRALSTPLYQEEPERREERVPVTSLQDVAISAPAIESTEDIESVVRPMVATGVADIIVNVAKDVDAERVGITAAHNGSSAPAAMAPSVDVGDAAEATSEVASEAELEPVVQRQDGKVKCLLAKSAGNSVEGEGAVAPVASPEPLFNWKILGVAASCALGVGLYVLISGANPDAQVSALNVKSKIDHSVGHNKVAKKEARSLERTALDSVAAKHGDNEDWKADEKKVAKAVPLPAKTRRDSPTLQTKMPEARKDDDGLKSELAQTVSALKPEPDGIAESKQLLAAVPAAPSVSSGATPSWLPPEAPVLEVVAGAHDVAPRSRDLPQSPASSESVGAKERASAMKPKSGQPLLRDGLVPESAEKAKGAELATPTVKIGAAFRVATDAISKIELKKPASSMGDEGKKAVAAAESVRSREQEFEGAKRQLVIQDGQLREVIVAESRPVERGPVEPTKQMRVDINSNTSGDPASQSVKTLSVTPTEELVPNSSVSASGVVSAPAGIPHGARVLRQPAQSAPAESGDSTTRRVVRVTGNAIQLDSREVVEEPAVAVAGVTTALEVAAKEKEVPVIPPLAETATLPIAPDGPEPIVMAETTLPDLAEVLPAHEVRVKGGSAEKKIELAPASAKLHSDVDSNKSLKDQLQDASTVKSPPSVATPEKISVVAPASQLPVSREEKGKVVMDPVVADAGSALELRLSGKESGVELLALAKRLYDANAMMRCLFVVDEALGKSLASNEQGEALTLKARVELKLRRFNDMQKTIGLLHPLNRVAADALLVLRTATMKSLDIPADSATSVAPAEAPVLTQPAQIPAAPDKNTSRWNPPSTDPYHRP